jgi:hypothetical protein
VVLVCVTKEEQEKTSFLKKRSKKLLRVGVRGAGALRWCGPRVLAG